MYIFDETTYFTVSAGELETIIQQAFNRPDYRITELEPNLLPIEIIDFTNGMRESYKQRRQEVLNFADRYHSGKELLPYLLYHLSVCKIIPHGRYLLTL